MRRLVDVTYTEDGDVVPSRFVQEARIVDHEAACVEVTYSDAPVPLRQLLRGASWGSQWVAQVDPGWTADVAICVFPPNVVLDPHGASLGHRGTFTYTP